MSLKLITPPAVEPLTPADVRTRLGLGASVTDDMLTPLIKAARQSLDGPDGYLGRALITQTWDLLYDTWPAEAIAIPLPPLQAIVEFTYIDGAGDEQIIAASNYTVDIQINRGWLVYASSFSAPAIMDTINAVKVRFRAGYGDAGSDVPEPIRQAMVLNVGQTRMLTGSALGLKRETLEGVGSWEYVLSEQGSAVMTSAAAALLAPYRIFN